MGMKRNRRALTDQEQMENESHAPSNSKITQEIDFVVMELIKNVQDTLKKNEEFNKRELKNLKNDTQQLLNRTQELKEQTQQIKERVRVVEEQCDSLFPTYMQTITRRFCDLFMYNVYFYIFWDPVQKKLNQKLTEKDIGQLEFDDLKILNVMKFKLSEDETGRWKEMVQMIEINPEFDNHLNQMKNPASKKKHPNQSMHLNDSGKKDIISLDTVEQLIIDEFGTDESVFFEFTVYDQFKSMKDWLIGQGVKVLNPTY